VSVSPSGGVRLGVGVAAGFVVAGLVGAMVGWPYAPAAGWIAAAAVYLAWTWLLVGRMNAAQTRSHATQGGDDDSSAPMIELIVVLASLASLAGVVYLLIAARGADIGSAAVGILSVAASWFGVHTAFMLRYARLYFDEPVGGIDFNQPDIAPTYIDFAYLAFTLGMTYQVSDTDLTTPPVRRTALFQSLVSFLLGAIVLAMTLNLVVGLAGSGQ
jgi:uncharacterized membrane protein